MVEATLTYVDGLQFVGKAASGHAIVLDGDTKYGGKDSGPRPTELLLLALGSCSAMSMVSILRKKKQEVTGLDVNVKGINKEEYPKRFTDIDVEFLIKGRRVSREAVRRAIELTAEKYCPVKATLDGSVNITFSYRIVRKLK